MKSIRDVLDGPEEAEQKLIQCHERATALAEAIDSFESTGANGIQADYWSRSLAAELAAPASDPSLFATRLEGLASRALAFVAGMSFGFLYDRERQIFAIGYRLADAQSAARLDGSFYDLLASEARLASFVAIAKGDVPDSHWFHLGRLLTSVDGAPTLLSWSASLFEYLMPLLVMKSYPGTLLDQSCRMAVRRQVEYGKQQGVPWGISESGFNVVDRHGNYQYKAFGVPGLGLKRGLGDELVVAPYATALAAMVDPEKAARNFRRLARDGMDGTYGYYEAIDYTHRKSDGSEAVSEPRAHGSTGVVVQTFLAHHQGMSLVALANAVLSDAMVQRFHADPRAQAVALLLQERAPRHAPITQPRPAEETRVSAPASAVALRRFRSPHTRYPHAQFLSNGTFTTVVTNSGGGASLCRGRAVTRYREDATRDLGSNFLYLRDVRSGSVWSATYHPTDREPEEYLVTLQAEKAVIRRRDEGIATQLDIAVSTEDDVEVRRLTVTNQSDRPRELEVTSYAEIALASLRDDMTHPVFSKLFVETEYLPESAALVCTRRPRSKDEGVWAVHVLSVDGRMQGPVEWETDRARFLGRGRSPEDPVALDGRPLSGTTGAVLDPIVSLRQRIRLAPGGFVRLSFATGMALSRDAALAMAQKYHDPSAAARTFALAFTHAQSTLRHLGISSDEAQLFERLASRVMYADASLRAWPELLSQNVLGQSGLWAHGISGDLPILLVRVVEDDAIPLVRQALHAQEYWRLKGLSADLVILNEHPVSYLDEMHVGLTSLLDSGPWGAWKHRPGGVYLLRGDRMKEEERNLLASVARAILSGDRGTLANQLEWPHPELLWKREPPPPPSPASRQDNIEIEMPVLTFANGTGGFADGGREYVVVLDGDHETPLPWVNVMANPGFGTVVSASGSAYTWAENSRENRLTPFANDPVTDPTAEAIFLRDDEAGDVWSPTPGPMQRTHESGRFVTRHRAGVSRFSHASHGILQDLAIFVDAKDPVKFSLLTLTNRTSRPRRLSVFAYNDWCLGPPRPGRTASSGDGIRYRDGEHPGNEQLQRALRWPGRLRPRQRGPKLGERRPALLPGPERLAGVACRHALPGPVRRTRRRARSLRRSAGGDHPGTGRGATPFLYSGTGPGSGACERTAAPPWQRGGRGSRPRRVAAILDRHPGDRPGAHPGRLLRSPHEPLAPVPGPELPALGPVRLLSAGRCLRLPGPIAGRHGPLPGAAAPPPRASRPSCESAVPRRGRAALVARARGPWRAHPLFRRPALAAPRRGALRQHHRRPRRARRSRPVPGGAGSRRRRDRGLRTAAGHSRIGLALRALPARHRQGPHHRSPRPPADRQRRLERRHEPGRGPGPRRKRLARMVRVHGVTSVHPPVRDPGPGTGGALRERGHPAGRHAGAVLGRGVVSAGLLRRRHAAGLGAER